MSVASYSDLLAHVGHEVVVVTYGNEANVAIECEDCCEVIQDFDKPDNDTTPTENGFVVNCSGYHNLLLHVEHHVEVVLLEDGAKVAVECVDCGEPLLIFNKSDEEAA